MGRRRRQIAKLADYSGLSLLAGYLHALGQPNAVFIWIPKTAGTSIFSLLNAPKLKSLHLARFRFPNRGIVTFGHMDYAELVRRGTVSRKFDRTSYKFAFSRDPYGRAVSLFYYVKRYQVLDETETFLSFCRRLADGQCDDIGLYNVRGMSQCNPQTRWLRDVDPDLVGRMDHLEQDSREIARHLRIDYESTPHLNPTDHGDYRDYYCQESRQIVEDFYAEDFRQLDYPMAFQAAV
ncbi:MAG: sulfotransferase family 2 domain-containing protein [Gammaproteobacteria bacterium]